MLAFIIMSVFVFIIVQFYLKSHRTETVEKLRGAADSRDSQDSNARKIPETENQIEGKSWPELNGPFNRNDPGEGGIAVSITAGEELLKNKAYAEYGFNQYVSDKISLHRSLPDPRSPL